jgi:sterol desaturase/sphingolipid hydroxylase (fatty acid hydroxylase superfamily)
MDAYIDSLWHLFDILGISAFAEHKHRIYYPYLLSSLLMAFFYYYFLKQGKSSNGISKFLRYIFPKKIWLHKSAVVDYQIFIFNNIIKAFLIGPYLIAHISFAYIVTRCWENLIGIQESIQWSSVTINIFYSIIFLITSDFSRYILHYCMHRIPLLWNFHKVHHSAEVLTPITLYRVHPLEYFFLKLRSVMIFGIVSGSFYFWFRTGIEPLSILKIHIGIFLFNLLGSNLRHSHVPIRFGDLPEHVLISPAQHQIHHGNEEKYFDKNYGSIFAIWDLMFGTLLISQKQEKINFGIKKEEQKEYRSLIQNIWTPVRSLFRGRS